MNSRQKIVQQQFIDNEKAVLNRLKQVYGKALDDINKNIEDLMSRTDSDTASVVYRVEYQKALKNQISGILDELNSNQFNTVSEYLATCYDDGYIGTMYDLHGQGIPIITPINQENVVRAVQLDSKISNGLYSRMGEDVSMLKKHITAQVSRGIANGSSFAQVAQQISFKMTGTYNTNGGALGNAMRIARTEGHRIQVQGAMDACYNAKEKGADIVKQWDSTLDARTRDSHAQVDGEIRELDEKFSNGLMYPADPSGGAAEVVNCRCALLQRAKWALDEKELETLKQRAAAFGIDKTENFDDFKQKYINQGKSTAKIKEVKNAYDFEYGNYTDDDFYDWQDHYDEHNKGVHLSDKELKVIDDYTEGSYIGMNGVTRGMDDVLIKQGFTPDDLAKYRKNADILDDALSKYDLDTDIVTHRFERDVSWLTGNGNGIDELESLIGKEYVEKGFTSSGMVANRFRFTGGKKDAVHFEIVTPKGTNGAYLSMSKKGEHEFLYNRNTRFKVLDGGERVVKERKYNLKTGKFDEIEVTERFLKVQVITDTADDVQDVVKIAKKKKFTPAKTLDDAEKGVKKYVNDNEWAGTGVSYKGVSVETANKVNETLSNLYETYDIDKLGGVYVAKGNTKLGKAVEGATAAYSPVRKSLILNNRSMKNVDDIAKSHAKEVAMIKEYSENPSAFSFKSTRGEMVAKASVKSGRATVPETIEDVIHHEMGHHIERTVYKANGYDVVKANMPKYAENISGYATISESEYIAESFASYLKGEGLIDPELAKIFESMKR